MRIILSRKGSDASNVGIPSPIFPDGNQSSLPIPGGSTTRYGDLAIGGQPVVPLIEELSGRDAPAYCHLDPDLARDTVPARMDGRPWRPAFGQVGTAQSHLENEGVSTGDLFLFYGWFREVAREGNRWKWTRGARDVHRLFGWLQVGAILRPGSRIESMRDEHPDLAHHPHLHGSWASNNTIYVAADELSLPGNEGPSRHPGAGLFDFRDKLARPDLTYYYGTHRSEWQLPLCFAPFDRLGLSYNRDPTKWRRFEDRRTALVTVPNRGQEFVIKASKGILDWVREYFPKD